MRILVTLIIILTFGHSFGQTKECYCDKDTLMNGATIDCKTTILKNKSRLYWQYNCDKIWLTLENLKGHKVILDEVEVDLYGYTYRLGYYLVKEFDKTLLFRSGCPANGPCNYSVVDKTTGKIIKQFGQLICIDTEISQDKKYQYDFLIYFSENYDYLKIYYVDTKKVLTIPFDTQKKNLTAVIPEYQFDSIILKRNLMTLNYTTTKGKKLNMKIDLSNKKYSR